MSDSHYKKSMGLGLSIPKPTYIVVMPKNIAYVTDG